MDYYATLGVDKSADEETIKKAYRKLAKIHHPDKGGNAEMFKKIQEAYETLGDIQKRKAYDNPQSPFAGFSGGGGGMHDMFSAFFGGQHQHQQQQQQTPPIPKPLQTILKVSLMDLFHGIDRIITLPIPKLCVPCTGKGGHDITPCLPCSKTGHITTHRQIGPNMVQQIKSLCPKCEGKGFTMSRKCMTCQGNKKQIVNEQIKVMIKPGDFMYGDIISIPHVGEEFEWAKPRQAIEIIIQEDVESNKNKKHDMFEVNIKTRDLFVHQKIHLFEALCSTSFYINHPSGRKLEIMPKNIIQPSSMKILKGYGLPLKNPAGDFGKLWMTFEIDFPQALTDTEKLTIQEVLNREQFIRPYPSGDLSPPLKVALDYEATSDEKEHFNQVKFEAVRQKREPGQQQQQCRQQ